MNTDRKHNHGEAFKHMQYACKLGCCHEDIWNSRDGVTPFMINSRRGHEMEHIFWDKDVYDKDYIPVVGERVFVDATPALVSPRAIEYVNRWWDDHKYPLCETWETKEEAIKFFIEEWSREGSPFLLVIDETNRIVFLPAKTV